MSDNLQPPADWYPDPDGLHQFRYWDGATWTDHVANDGVQSTSPLQQASKTAESEAPTSNKQAVAGSIGVTEAVCPYCSAQLEKFPGRKKRCPECGESIYVRTRPSDRSRILVREDELEEVERQWTAHNALNSALSRVDPDEFEAEKAAATAKAGWTPSDNDILWGMCNRHLLEHATQQEWGLYRNTRMTMAELLRGETKLKQALDTYLEIVYIDVNGPRNIGGITSASLLEEFPPFDPHEGFIAPGIVSLVEGLQSELQLSEESLKHRFIEVSARIQHSMRLPVSPEQAWGDLELARSGEAV